MDETEQVFAQFAKDLERAIANECIEAIEDGQSDKAMMLLPCMKNPSTTVPFLLHSAARNGLVDLIVELVCTYKFDVERATPGGWKPIHMAAYEGHVEVLQLLITAFNCSLNPETVSEGDTPLILACKGGHVDAVVSLTTASGCDVNARRQSDGSTALHLACANGNFGIVQHLVASCNADVNVVSNDGATPLHYCASIKIVQYLVGSGGAKVSVRTREGETLLHLACSADAIDLVQYLLEEQHCDPQCCDINGYTPLHFACEGKATWVARYLLSTGKVDPMARTSAGSTPVELATDYETIRLFEPFEQCHISFPVESISKVFHAGNSAVGKSSLANVFLGHTRFAPDHKFGTNEEVSGVEGSTAGIIPLYVQHPKAGNLMLYDFAGHPEFYSSHCAILRSIMKRIPGIFVVMVDLSNKQKDIAKQLHYWLSLIENLCGLTHGPSQVIIVGSHADVLAGKLPELEDKTKLVHGIAQRMVKMQAFLGFVALDCRKLTSEGLDQYIALLIKGCKAVLASTPVISFYCHVLYAFLKTKLDVPALVLDSLSVAILAENSPSLPPDMNVLVSFLTTLSDKGLILFLKNEKQLESSWIVVKQEALLREVCGTLFAPVGFQEHRTLSSNTGVVPFSVLSDVFPHHEPDMLLGFLKFFDFCQEIDPVLFQNMASNIRNDLHPLSEGSHLLFFPALINVDRPVSYCLDHSKRVVFGWCLACNNPCHFFTPQFLHMFQLHMSFGFTQAKKLTPDAFSSISGFHRRCEVWKNGIRWWNKYDIAASVEMVDQSRRVQLVITANIACVVEYVKLRSALICLILDLQQKLCPCLCTHEFLMSPCQLCEDPLPPLDELVLFDIKDVSSSLFDQSLYVIADSGTPSRVRVQDLISFEPYCLLDPSLTSRLYDVSISNDPVPECMLHDIQKQLGQLSDLVSPGNHLDLQGMLNHGSIYAGRSPLQLAGIESSSMKCGLKQVQKPAAENLLGIRDLRRVFFSTSDVNQWLSLGLALGLHYPTLEKIEIEKERIDDRRRQMLVAWLQQKDDVVAVALPTWRALESALRKIKENVVADQITKDYLM